MGGCIGLGIAGRPTAKNLLNAGHELVVHDINREPVKELVASESKEAFSPKEVAAQSDVIITMLPDSRNLEFVA